MVLTCEFNKFSYNDLPLYLSKPPWNQQNYLPIQAPSLDPSSNPWWYFKKLTIFSQIQVLKLQTSINGVSKLEKPSLEIFPLSLLSSSLFSPLCANLE